ncbi:MAG: protein kinase [Nannocystaceae bacterium]|nr:protein kinase [Nannocystaceae bacterium]
MAGCPDPSQLEAFALGRLPERDRAALELHIDRCSACATTLVELARMFGGDGSVGDEHATTGGARSLPTAPARAAATAVPTSVGRYVLGRRLGQGGMGVVFEAHDPELHRRVAIKLLHPGAGDAEATRARMLREARAMARLAHPNVVAVHDVGSVGGQIFVAMELVEGTTLAQWLRASPRTRSQILAIFVQAGRGLQAAHDVGLVHRDFKPDNVLIGVDGRARVTDFGLARPTMAWPDAPTGGAIASEALATHGTTAHGTLVGTPAYMAPEQWRGEPADARSDQFSFCVALAEAVFGERPFAGRDLYALADAVLRGEPRPLPRSAPAWLRTAITTGLAVDPAARHRSMAPLLAALERDRGRALRWGGVALAMGAAVAITVATMAQLSDRGPAPATERPTLEPSAPPTPQPQAAVAPPPPPAVADPACLSRAATLDGRWLATRRDALRERIATMDDGEALAARVLPPLDAWAAAWTAQAVAACAPGAEPDPDRERARCRDDARARFDATLQRALELPSFDVDDSLAHAIAELPPISPCIAAAWAGARTQRPAPQAEALVGRAALVTDALAAAEALTALDRYAAAPEALTAALEQARALGHAPLLAQAQLSLGLAHAGKYEPEAAVAALGAAAELAAGGVDDRVLVRAAIALVHEHGAVLLDRSEGERWRQIAATTLARRPDPALQAELVRAQAQLELAHGELLAAAQLLEDSLQALPTDATLPRAYAGQTLAQVRLELGELDAAAAAAAGACTALQRVLGPRDLRVAECLALQGRVAIARGDLAAAQTAIDAAIAAPFPSQSLRHDLDRGRYHGARVELQLAQGDAASARRSAETAAIYLYTGALTPWPPLWQARALARTPTAPAAAIATQLAAATTALDEALPQTDDPRRIEILQALAAVQAERGRRADAIATLERALAVAESTLGFGPRTASVQWQLAAIERDAGHRARALALFDDAHVPMASALGTSHPRVSAATLARADLAWDLGQHDYGGRLYAAVADELATAAGAEDPRTQRARARARAEP